MFKLFLGLLLAGLSTSANSTCDWSKPGDDPYTGRPDTAVHAFKDMPWLARHLLSQRVGRGAPDDMVRIERDAIKGSSGIYANEIRSMHFGAGRVCPSVSRVGWAIGHAEMAEVWCTHVPLDRQAYCVARPRVCGNYFEITRVAGAAGAQHNVPGPSTGTLVGLGLALLVLRRK